MRAWTHFACALAVSLIALLAAAHFAGPRLVQLSDLLPTQTLRAQMHLLQNRAQQPKPTDVIILGDSTASRSLSATRIEKKLNEQILADPLWVEVYANGRSIVWSESEPR